MSVFLSVLLDQSSNINLFLKKHFIEAGVSKNFVKIKDIAPMVKYKMRALNRIVDLSEKRKTEFLNQLQTDLRLVLRQKDFEHFDFEEAWSWLKTLEKEISKSL